MSSQNLTERFIQFYQDHYRDEIEELAQRYPDEQRSLYVDYRDLNEFDEDLAEDLHNHPDRMREYAEEALRLCDLPADTTLNRAHVRITNPPAMVEIGEIRVQDDLTGCLVSFRGVVRKATDVRPKLTEAAFECQRCGTMTYIPQDNGEYREPHMCQGCENAGPFQLNSDQSEMVDSQQLTVQATPDGGGTEEVPASIEVDVVDDICGVVTPGDHITVSGILRTEQLEEGNSKQMLFDLYVDGLSLTVNSELSPEPTKTDEEEIKGVSERDDVYELFVDSIAPSIRGLEEEKLAVLLQLFSGISIETEAGEVIRGQIHLLLVGDPAVGLSRILRSAAALSPRSTYSNGAETSKAGITAAAARTGGVDGPWELKAGALPIADRGLAAIDNFAQIDGNIEGALSEPMEQQQITVSKASIHESIDTRVGVLAAGSPEHGRFDQYEPIADQLPVDTQLLSLFDLIFTVTDSPHPEVDESIATHVLDINQAGEQRQADETAEPSESGSAPLEASFIRKYISHARNITPVLSAEAKEHISEFYVNLRSKGADEDAPVPVSARKLDAMVRLSEASARVRLSDSIEVEDAKRATDIVESCLKDMGVDPVAGQFDADVVETDTSKQQSDRAEYIKELIDNIEEEYQEGAPVDEVLDRAGEMGMDPGKTEQGIENLRVKGEVYEPKQGHIRTS